MELAAQPITNLTRLPIPWATQSYKQLIDTFLQSGYRPQLVIFDRENTDAFGKFIMVDVNRRAAINHLGQTLPFPDGNHTLKDLKQILWAAP